MSELTLYGVFLRDYYDRFKSISAVPILHIPGLEWTDETLQWIMDRLDREENFALLSWVDARFKLHLKKGKGKRWAWYVTNPGYSGMWLSNKKVAKDVFEYH